MEAKTNGAIAICYFFFLVLCSVSTGLKYQTLSLSRPLRKTPQKLDDLSWNNPSVAEIFPEMAETGLRAKSKNFHIVSLQHIDAIASGNMTLRGRLERRLHLDSKRVMKIMSELGGSAGGQNFHDPFAGQKHHPLNDDGNKNGSRSGGGAREYNSSIVSGQEFESGEYFARLRVGTPSQFEYFILDTGSDVSWLQCLPCRGRRHCYKQTDKVFDPEKSRSFAVVPCDSGTCKEYHKSQDENSSTPECGDDGEGKGCLYQVSYGDGSFTRGHLVTETLGFRTNYVPNVSMGCGHDNQGMYGLAGGVLGLGRGRFSFPSQTRALYGGKFSYCLAMDHGTGSKRSNGAWLMFGEPSVSRDTVFTPLLESPSEDMSTFYFVGLTGFGVGGEPVEGIGSSTFAIDKKGKRGGVIMDSGTVVSRIKREAYEALRDAFVKATKGLKRAGGLLIFDTCYDFSEKKQVNLPVVELYFGNASVSLPAQNLVVPLDDVGTYCFAFAPSNGEPSIIGNLQQQGFRVAFDLIANRVGFAPDKCK